MSPHPQTLTSAMDIRSCLQFIYQEQYRICQNKAPSIEDKRHVSILSELRRTVKDIASILLPSHPQNTPKHLEEQEQSHEHPITECHERYEEHRKNYEEYDENTVEYIQENNTENNMEFTQYVESISSDRNINIGEFHKIKRDKFDKGEVTGWYCALRNAGLV